MGDACRERSGDRAPVPAHALMCADGVNLSDADDTGLDAGLAALRDLAAAGRRYAGDTPAGDGLQDVLFVMLAPVCTEVKE